MDLEQHLGRYAQLHHELAEAMKKPITNASRIDRLTADLILTDRRIADLSPVDEQCGERLLG